MQLERRADPDGQTLGWMLDDGQGARVWCGELERAEFLELPREQRIGLRDDLGWYLVEITGEVSDCRRAVLARVCDEVTGLKLARAYLLGSRDDGLRQDASLVVEPAAA